ncbi:YibE/F family protein [Pediococcus ethanolidurans]|uniref:YibE/F family protein n=1 Tax=Pediococcus ethanolidurans TaxID=319653 RepID=UPI001C1E9B26|nr:YibE/F family protein [Pediococcus ethanolidurans]MBU7554567.1 YibE/F family protein [Pediococcus ethanolidurans]MBU7562966.1 YibE/F family protein [Pediococcus ethanolidurans]MCV3314824.1 YibE/F family protein [Pediococcus ethanolidurans]MCV3320949.1 YibE/F family protein [Pediococcus ethanolidurans]MCV3324051.1 YibE/F family protein [Pediococcus ethanolidurans]
MNKIQPKYQASWLTIILVILLGGLLCWATQHDAALYQTPVGQVIKVTNQKKVSQTDNFHNHDFSQKQLLKVRILNGHYRNKVLRVQNTFSASNAMDQAYRKNQQLFLNIQKKANHKLQGTITDLKRDTVIVFLSFLAISLLLLTMKFSGFMALLSVLLNGVLFFLAIKLDVWLQGTNILLIFGILAFVFAGLTLFLVLGKTKQMLVTFGATILGTVGAVIVTLLVLKFTHEQGLHFEMMEYVTQNLQPVFIAETILGSLGAVMDESTDIISSLFALHRETPNITQRQLFLSGREIGKSIMGPLINVLFLIFMADTFGMMVLYLRNGDSWSYAFTMNMSLGMVQSLVSGIGIVLAIPAASWFASSLLKRGDRL